MHDTDGDQFLGTVSVSWGDGSPDGNGTDLTHTYTDPGNYNVTATTTLESDFTQTVNVVAFEPAPIAVDDSFTTPKETQLSASVADNDIPSPNLAAALWQVVTPPMHGTLSAWPGNGTFVYDPETGYAGLDSFTYDLINVNTLVSSRATATITVTGTLTDSHSIKAWYLGRQVYLAMPDHSLVFDGQNFVRPQDAKYVALISTFTTGPFTVPSEWPETQTINQVALTWPNMILAQVIDANSPPITGNDLITVTDPHDGACVCGISCFGTELQFVQVVAA
jgi:hypothetical protein